MKDLKKIIKDFAKRPNKEMMLMIDGKWGVGKTYFLKNLNSKEFGKEKIIFISLKGIKTLEDINRRVIAEIWKIGKKINLFSKVAQNAIQAGTGGVINISLTDLVSVGFDWKKLNNFIIIFDDFERISCENISYPDVLFEIHNTYVEDKNASVIIVANEKEIFVNLAKAEGTMDDQKQNFDEIRYRQAKEKTIERVVTFSRYLRDFFQEYIKARYSKIAPDAQEFLSKNKIVSQILQQEDISNLRTYNRFFDLFVQIYEATVAQSAIPSHKMRFLNEILVCLRDNVLHAPLKQENPSEDIPSLEYVNLPTAYVRIEMFPSIKQLIVSGFLNIDELKKDLNRRSKAYRFDSSVSKDLNVIRRWFMTSHAQDSKSFANVIKKSNKFTTYDLFLETMRALSWFFKSGMIEEELYRQYKEALLNNFEKFLLKSKDLNLSISGMNIEQEFIDTLEKCKQVKIQEQLHTYEHILFVKNQLIEDASFAEFVKKNPKLVLEMYTKNASKVAEVTNLYAHTKFLVGCLRHSHDLAHIQPSPWIELASKIIDHLTDPAAAAVAQMMLDEVITEQSPSYDVLNNKLKIQKDILLKRNNPRKK